MIVIASMRAVFSAAAAPPAPPVSLSAGQRQLPTGPFINQTDTAKHAQTAEGYVDVK